MSKDNLELSKQYQLIEINKVFESVSENMIDIFLCGGASTKDNISFRDKLNEYIQGNFANKVRIFYPEDLFIGLLNSDKKQNMLELENFLANNSDIVCIVAESVGSFVELGAFVNNDDIREKVIALIEKKYKGAKSFLNLGPIGLLKREGKEKVLYYKKDEIEDTGRKIIELSSRINREQNNKLRLDSIVGLSYFLLLLLYFYEELNFDDFKKYVNFIFKHSKVPSNYSKDVLIRSAMKLLFKEKNIIKKDGGILNNQKIVSSYALSKKGIIYVRNFLGIEEGDFKHVRNKGYVFASNIRLYDKIRFDIMRTKYYS